MTILFFLAVVSTFVTTCLAATPDEWRSRTIYHLLVDRFAQDTDDGPDCTDLSKYCNGTWAGIEAHLDYIEGLGADAIWISPVIDNIEQGYHGYWGRNFYELNSHFGSYDDLMSLIDAMHDRDMYVMIDVVANHCGGVAGTDFSTIYPFNDASHYHSCDSCPWDCQIDDWSIGGEEIQICRLAGLPDFNQTVEFVHDRLCWWARDYIVDYWRADGIRIDTVPEIENGFWEDFIDAADTEITRVYQWHSLPTKRRKIKSSMYVLGELWNGDPYTVGPYQDVLIGLFNYPMYYPILNAFGGQNSITYQLDTDGIARVEAAFDDVNYLGAFIENHDNQRFLCTYSDDTNHRRYENAMTFGLTWKGIPLIYYGAEQGFDGCDDPNNREALWSTNYNTSTPLYVFLKTLNAARKSLEIWNTTYTVVSAGSSQYAYQRGDQFLVILSNVGDTGTTQSLTFTPELTFGSYANIYWPTGDTIDIVNVSDHTFSIDSGEVKVYIPTDLISDTTLNYYNH